MKTDIPHPGIATTPADLGDWFRRERRLRKLTQDEVAKRVGCRRQTIAELERGENVGIYIVLKALSTLDCALAIRPRDVDDSALHLFLDPEDRDHD